MDSGFVKGLVKSHEKEEDLLQISLHSCVAFFVLFSKLISCLFTITNANALNSSVYSMAINNMWVEC